jgi:hypothetical protein
VRDSLTFCSTIEKQPSHCRACSIGQSWKLMTHRLAEQFRRKFKSSPMRYEKSTSLLRGSLEISCWAASGYMVKPRPRMFDPWNDWLALAASRRGLPETRDRGSSDGVMACTWRPSRVRGSSSCAWPTNSRETSRDAVPGQGWNFTAR